MAGFKETPRQKMIGMMYLFYTALLALNVSVEILNAFIIVNDGMERTVSNFGDKNALIYNDFEKQMALNAAKTKPFYDKAIEVKTITDKLVAHLENVKDQLVGYVEFGDKDIKNVTYKGKDDDGNTKEFTVERPSEVPLEFIRKQDDYNKANIIMGGVGSEKFTNGEATKLKNEFAQYKKDIFRILIEAKIDTVGLNLGLETEDKYNQHAGQKQNWETNTFYRTILAADLVLLNKYITEVRNIEFEALKKIMSKISADDFKFDVISAKVIPHANIVLSGESYTADIFVAAYSSTETPTVILKNGLDSVMGSGENMDNMEGTITIDSAQQGVVRYNVKTGSTGDFKYAGVIKIKDPAGKYQYHKFNSAYSVISPSATISADKMNVVYRGLNNPISISASGFTLDRINLVSSGGGTLTRKSAGHYEFKPTPTGNNQEVFFSVTGTDASGKSFSLVNKQKFRVMPLPSPTVTLAGKKEGKISRQLLASNPYLFAVLENFVFEGVKYDVKSFTLYVGAWRTSVTGSTLPASAIAKIKSAPSGTVIRMNDLKTVGPDGEKYATGPNFEIQ